MPKTYKMTERNIPGLTPSAEFNGKTDYYLLEGGSAIYQDLIPLINLLIKVRPKREYLDFSIALTDFTREIYDHSETPKSFMSEVS